MSIIVASVADRIRNGLIKANELSNLRKFAQKEGMLLHSVPLKDGTAVKILANAFEYDCLVMKNGKVLTARGQIDTTDSVAEGILGLFERIKKRGKADQNVDVDLESFKFIDDYLNRYEHIMLDV